MRWVSDEGFENGKLNYHYYSTNTPRVLFYASSMKISSPKYLRLVPYGLGWWVGIGIRPVHRWERFGVCVQRMDGNKIPPSSYCLVLSYITSRLPLTQQPSTFVRSFLIWIGV